MPRSPHPRQYHPSVACLLAVLALAVTTVSGLGTTPAAAEAGPIAYGYTGGEDPIRQPDSRDHWHCKTHFPVHHDWVNSAMDQLAAQTVIERHDSAVCRPHTDVVWVRTKRGALNDGDAAGQTVCMTHVSWGVCDQYWVYVDERLLSALSQGQPRPHRDSWYRNNLHLTLRHELGHTAGLHHNPQYQLNTRFGPMVSAPITANHPRALEFLAYKPFQVALINHHL